MLEVLFEDAHLIAVNKPAGMPSQPDRTNDESLIERMSARWADAALGLVHRLDRPVSGVILFARDVAMLSSLSAAFRDRQVSKTYMAIIEGCLSEPGQLEHHLDHDGQAMRARITKFASNDGDISRLRYRPLAVGDRYTLLEVVPEGGAFHQIRAQLSAVGHAIKGDVKYGARRGEKDRSIGLHAQRVVFTHPATGSTVNIQAPAPKGSLWDALISMADNARSGAA